ncbi:MAG: ABC transporter ATP-binding protein [Candidatus Riflebacteria bacterium]|nr:ABC transporter ATP-binding protein [Candidatus Riflebacteria bacterium]
MSSEVPVINFENVDFSYDGSEELVLENINLIVEKGEFACVVGPNGGGKTTLLRLILGLNKPLRGKISLFGQSPEQVRHRIGYVPQFSKFDSNFPVSVLDVVLMGCLSKSFWWGSFSKKQTQDAIEALETVGLKNFVHKSFADLSGGQKQRALIARAIMSQPELLLLDEPTASVDIHGTEQFYKMFAEMNKKFTILIVSHDIGFVSSKVKSVICVRKNLQIHPVSELTGESLQKMYGLDVHLIRHDHRCSEKGHSCPHL